MLRDRASYTPRCSLHHVQRWVQGTTSRRAFAIGRSQASPLSLPVIIRLDFRVKTSIALLTPVRQDSKYRQQGPLDQPVALRSTNCGRTTSRAVGMAPNLHVGYSTASSPRQDFAEGPPRQIQSAQISWIIDFPQTCRPVAGGAPVQSALTVIKAAATRHAGHTGSRLGGNRGGIKPWLRTQIECASAARTAASRRADQDCGVPPRLRSAALLFPCFRGIVY